MNRVLIMYYLFLFLLLTNCKKEAGEGGTSSIRGNVWEKKMNSAYKVVKEYAAADKDVYIVYGDNVGYNNHTKTDYNGFFEFKYLNIGKYKVYVYSDDSAYNYVSSGHFAVVKEIEISKRKEVVEVPQFIIFND